MTKEENQVNKEKSSYQDLKNEVESVSYLNRLNQETVAHQKESIERLES